MDESGRTARPNRNKPGMRIFDARREQIVERVPVSREDYFSTRRLRRECRFLLGVELQLRFCSSVRFPSFPGAFLYCCVLFFAASAAFLCGLCG